MINYNDFISTISKGIISAHLRLMINNGGFNLQSIESFVLKVLFLEFCKQKNIINHSKKIFNNRNQHHPYRKLYLKISKQVPWVSPL